MIDLPTIYALLLLPVAFLLLLSRRLARRVSYPHELLVGGGRRSAAALLPRAFRMHHDLLFDAALAFVVALALMEALPPELRSKASGAAGGASAVVLDCSRSMFAGAPGSRPIDRAIALVEGRRDLAAADRWLLASDPATLRSRLLRWKDIAGARSGVAAASWLGASLPLFSVDYRELAGLSGRGYSRIVLVLDSSTFAPRGFEVVEVGFGEAPPAEPGGEAGPPLSESGSWPASVRRDRTRDSYIADFVEWGRRGKLTIRSFDEVSGSWAAVSGPGYVVVDGEAGREASLPGPGLFHFDFSDPAGGIGADFSIRVSPATVSALAQGAFSKRIMGVFPFLEEGPRPRLLFLDRDERPPKAVVPGSTTFVSALVDDEPLVADPALSLGRPLASGLVRGSDFAWGSAALANEDLPLVYDTAIQAAMPAAFSTEAPAGATTLIVAGRSSWIALGRAGTVPINPPAGEYIYQGRSAGLIEILPGVHRLRWTLLALLLLAGKHLVRRLLSGRGAFPAASSSLGK